MVGNSNNETNFPRQLILTNRQVLAAINKKKILGSGNQIILIISNDDMQDLLKIVTSLEDNGILSDGITETVKNEVKEKKGGFFIYVFRYFRCFFAW